MTSAETLLNPARLAEITRLDSGGHKGPEAGMCIMEAVSYVAGETWSDRPDCVCPLVGAFMRSWNDALPDELRTEVLLPLIPKITGSVVSRDAQVRRAYALADGAARIFAPAALRAAGIIGCAETLEALPEITDATTVAHAREALQAAYAAAYAAADAAYAAADAAADAAAYAARAADAAARAAADAAADAAYAAAYAARAAYAAARAAYAAADAADAAYAAAYAAADAARAADAAADAAAYAARAAADAARIEFWRGLNPKIVALVERVLAITDESGPV